MKELFKRLFANRILAIELVISSLFINILGLASSLYVIQVLNRYIANGIDATLITLTAGVLIAIVMEFGFRQVRLKFAQGVNAEADNLLATKAFAVLTGSKVGVLERMSTARRREVMSSMAAVQQAYAPPNLVAVLDVPFALLFLAVLSLLSSIIAMIVAVFLAAVLFYSLISQGRLKKPIQALTQAGARNNALVNSVMLAADTVRIFNAVAFLRGLWAKQQDMTQGFRQQVAKRQGFSQAITQSSAALMSVVVIAVGAKLAVAGELDVGSMIGINILASRALALITRFSQLGTVMTKANQSLELLEQFTTLPQELTKGVALKEYRGRVTIKDVGFVFPGASGPLFESLSFDLEPGGILAVTGGNGMGKTTLARLMVGLLEPMRGQILVDGVELRQVVPEWWRRQLIYFPQEPNFFDGTILDNLRTINPDLDQETLNRIVNISGLEKFLSESPKGLDTPLLNGGMNLATGIRRRLALARGLTTRGRLAIFDEPTQGLDAEGRSVVYGVLNKLAQDGCTVVVCSHDPKIFKGAGLLLNLDHKPVPKLVVTAKAATAEG